MTIIGTLCFVGLAVLDIRYALVLAVLAGLFEFIPYLGPILSAIPAVFFAYIDHPWKALAVAIIYFVIQQLENQLIVPKIMQKAVGLNPIIVICAMLIGHMIVPFFGILLAVPATTIAWIFLGDLFQSQTKPDSTTPVNIT
jgi:predicted PurR-regulated permease PerM